MKDAAPERNSLGLPSTSPSSPRARPSWRHRFCPRSSIASRAGWMLKSGRRRDL